MTAPAPRQPPGQHGRHDSGEQRDPAGLPGDAAARVRELRTGEDWAAWLRLLARLPGRDLDAVLPAWPREAGAGQAGRRPAGNPRALPEGCAPPGLWDALAWLARRHGFAVERASRENAVSSTTWRARRISISAGLDGPAGARALLHELGHVLLHGDAGGHPADGSTAGCQGVRKVEADSVAFVVSERLGLDTSGYAWPYVASWAGSDLRARPDAAILTATRHITTAAAAITGHLDVALFGKPTEQAEAVALCASQPAGTAVTAGSLPPAPARAQAEPASAVVARLVPAEISRALRDAGQFYLDRVPGSWVPGYLAQRGLREDAARRWRIGYAPAGWTALTTHLRVLGHHDDVIQAAGLARRSSRGTLIDYFRDRVMLPVRAADGTIAGFTGRAHPTAGADVPRYVNSPETVAYVKGDLLFGLHEARLRLSRGAVPVIVEGPFDAIAVTLADPRRYAGLAPCGTALTIRQVAALAGACDVGEVGVIVALDGDRAGRDAAVKAYGVLSPVTSKAVAVILPEGRDPADILQADGSAALRAVLRQRAEPLARVVIDAHLDQWSPRLHEAEGQLGALRGAASLIASTLPAGTVGQVLRITDGRRMDPVSDDLRPLAHPELPQIARLLPVGAACQITRAAERLTLDLSDVIAEVANALASDAASSRRRAAHSAPGRQELGGRPLGETRSVRLSAVAFPEPPVADPGARGRSPPRSRPVSQHIAARSVSQRAARS